MPFRGNIVNLAQESSRASKKRQDVLLHPLSSCCHLQTLLPFYGALTSTCGAMKVVFFFSVDADDTTKGGMKEATCFIYGCLPKRYSKKVMTDATFESCRHDFTFSFIAGPKLTMVVLQGTARFVDCIIQSGSRHGLRISYCVLGVRSCTRPCAKEQLLAN